MGKYLNEYKRKDILITGGAGFVGSHLAEFLINRGDSVIILDNLNTGKESNIKKIINQVKFVDGDIRDFDLLKEELKELEVDGVSLTKVLSMADAEFAIRRAPLLKLAKPEFRLMGMRTECGLKPSAARNAAVTASPSYS